MIVDLLLSYYLKLFYVFFFSFLFFLFFFFFFGLLFWGFLLLFFLLSFGFFFCCCFWFLLGFFFVVVVVFDFFWGFLLLFLFCSVLFLIIFFVFVFLSFFFLIKKEVLEFPFLFYFRIGRRLTTVIMFIIITITTISSLVVNLKGKRRDSATGSLPVSLYICILSNFIYRHQLTTRMSCSRFFFFPSFLISISLFLRAASLHSWPDCSFCSSPPPATRSLVLT